MIARSSLRLPLLAVSSLSLAAIAAACGDSSPLTSFDSPEDGGSPPNTTTDAGGHPLDGAHELRRQDGRRARKEPSDRRHRDSLVGEDADQRLADLRLRLGGRIGHGQRRQRR